MVCKCVIKVLELSQNFKRLLKIANILVVKIEAIHCAQTYLQLPIRQWVAGNVYLLALSSWKVNTALPKTPLP